MDQAAATTDSPVLGFLKQTAPGVGLCLLIALLVQRLLGRL